ncbi:hypothetical protein N9N67_06970 [Bacteriovoracaceae bacterium]|nr:hypothetical protein [Bacteriovoracaceae bacterium]
MKNIMFIILAYSSFSLFAFDKGDCSFKAKDLTNEVLFDVCGSTKVNISDISVDECLERANRYLQHTRECIRTTIYPFIGLEKKKAYSVYSNKVKYTFKNEKTKIKGTITRD